MSSTADLPALPPDEETDDSGVDCSDDEDFEDDIDQGFEWYWSEELGAVVEKAGCHDDLEDEPSSNIQVDKDGPILATYLAGEMQKLGEHYHGQPLSPEIFSLPQSADTRMALDRFARVEAKQPARRRSGDSDECEEGSVIGLYRAMLSADGIAERVNDLGGPVSVAKHQVLVLPPLEAMRFILNLGAYTLALNSRAAVIGAPYAHGSFRRKGAKAMQGTRLVMIWVSTITGLTTAAMNYDWNQLRLDPRFEKICQEALLRSQPHLADPAKIARTIRSDSELATRQKYRERCTVPHLGLAGITGDAADTIAFAARSRAGRIGYTPAPDPEAQLKTLPARRVEWEERASLLKLFDGGDSGRSVTLLLTGSDEQGWVLRETVYEAVPVGVDPSTALARACGMKPDELPKRVVLTPELCAKLKTATGAPLGADIMAIFAEYQYKNNSCSLTAGAALQLLAQGVGHVIVRIAEWYLPSEPVESDLPQLAGSGKLLCMSARQLVPFADTPTESFAVSKRIAKAENTCVMMRFGAVYSSDPERVLEKSSPREWDRVVKLRGERAAQIAAFYAKRAERQDWLSKVIARGDELSDGDKQDIEGTLADRKRKLKAMDPKDRLELLMSKKRKGPNDDDN